MKEYLVGPLQELSDRNVKVVEVGDVEIGVFLVDGEVVAYENRCPHQNGPVCYGEILGKQEAILDAEKRVIGERLSDTVKHLICPWHGWEYDVRTGECATDRKYRLRRFPTTVKDGNVYVMLSDEGGERIP